MSKPLFIFSGLGADERAFQLLDISDFKTVFIKWEIPGKDESIERYVSRLIAQITDEEPTLIGLSFGGMIAIEVAKQIKAAQVILISSAKTKYEIPYYFRFAGRFHMHRLLPAALLKRSNYMSNWLFGAKSASAKQLLKQILRDTDSDFLLWAIDQVARWKNAAFVQNVVHIHGTADRILPGYFVNCEERIKHGGHLMVLEQAAEVSALLRKYLQ